MSDDYFPILDHKLHQVYRFSIRSGVGYGRYRFIYNTILTGYRESIHHLLFKDCSACSDDIIDVFHNTNIELPFSSTIFLLNGASMKDLILSIAKTVLSTKEIESSLERDFFLLNENNIIKYNSYSCFNIGKHNIYNNTNKILSILPLDLRLKEKYISLYLPHFNGAQDRFRSQLLTTLNYDLRKKTISYFLNANLSKNIIYGGTNTLLTNIQTMLYKDIGKYNIFSFPRDVFENQSEIFTSEFISKLISTGQTNNFVSIESAKAIYTLEEYLFASKKTNLILYNDIIDMDHKDFSTEIVLSSIRLLSNKYYGYLYNNKSEVMFRNSFCNLLLACSNENFLDILNNTYYKEQVKLITKLRRIIYGSILDLFAINSSLMYKNDETIVNYITQALSEFSKNKIILLTKNTEEINTSIQKCILAAINSGLVKVENEKELVLWQRFWFIVANGETDRIILPSHDYPYEDDPLVFNGFDDLIPKNYHVIYPNTFFSTINHHPIENGKNIGIKEIPLAINIIVEIINIYILMWSRFHNAFWGWTGVQAVLGIVSEILHWLSLETSRILQDDLMSREHYDRCYRWIRWEAEKVILLARNDMELRGNYYVEVLLKELLLYLEEHHFDTTPIYDNVGMLDKWKQFATASVVKELNLILEKTKGIRYKILIEKEKEYNV